MKETRKLMVRLTDTEIETRGRELATCLVNKGKLEERKKELNAVIKPLVERAVELSETIERGEEIRTVDCQWEYHWEHGTRVLYRPDTGEEIESDVIPEHEKQQRLGM